MPPEPSVVSSYTYSDHNPFGFEPMRLVRLVPNGPGRKPEPLDEAGNGMLVENWVGLYVPDTGAAVVRDEPALSSNVKVTLVMKCWPPALAMSRSLWPLGPTSNMLTSEIEPCERFETVAVTLPTRPFCAETAMVAGYGAAAPMSGIVITDGLL